ncbi:MAG: UDP-glucose 4-epimerase GalE [Imperialibacter sp.]|uniref:UDP-glucose 4-epimerase GalE n=1 Tax=Imperialibacter sp. TaxID=2038411 RepID=UPI0032ECBCCE
MANNQILVTGGLGYIGSHTVVELINAGFEPIIIDNLSNSEVKVLDAIEKITGKRCLFHQVEMCNYNELESIFIKYPEMKAAIHFAAFLLVNESVDNPLKYYENNLLSTINLLKCQSKFGTKGIIFSSSCTVYGNPEVLPVAENAPIQEAVSPYGNTKKMCEDIIRDTTVASDVKAIALRYFNPIGAHPTSLIGEVQHGMPHHLVPFITETAHGKREFLRVFGDDYNTVDGSCVRDYIYVMDVAKAHVNAVQRFANGAMESSYEVYNLGMGVGMSVIQMIQAFERATGINIPYKIVDRRGGDVEAVYADTSLANKKLNWKTQFGIEEALKSAWDWEIAQAKLKQ